jgi:hypothetical protein
MAAKNPGKLICDFFHKVFEFGGFQVPLVTGGDLHENHPSSVKL